MPSPPVAAAFASLSMTNLNLGQSMRAALSWLLVSIAVAAIPVHPLHAQQYPSIGCQVCTTPVQPGEDPRAGRWRHLRAEGEEGPRYCGINFTDGSGI